MIPGIAISLVAVSWQTIRMASAKPVDSLRSEQSYWERPTGISRVPCPITSFHS
ncbi:MAG: hypothetical protein ABI707_08365 [Ferruginibacter sp.]